MDFQIVDSQLGAVGGSQIVDTSGVYRATLLRISDAAAPSALWMDWARASSETTKLVRKGSYFAMMYGGYGVPEYLIHGPAVDAGLNHIERRLGGRNSGLDITQNGDVYTAGIVYGSDNFDTTGSDVQGSPASAFITRINADGSYGWTKSHESNWAGYVSVTADTSGHAMALGKFSYDLRDYLGNMIPAIGGTDPFIAHLEPIE